MFSRVMNKGLEGVPNGRIGSFIDDILIYSKSFLEHFASLQLTYNINKDTNIKLYSEVRKPGHLISYSPIQAEARALDDLFMRWSQYLQ